MVEKGNTKMNTHVEAYKKENNNNNKKKLKWNVEKTMENTPNEEENRNKLNYIETKKKKFLNISINQSIISIVNAKYKNS